MENSLRDADRMITEIDQNLLNLYDASENKTAYQFFDFFEALIVLNEYVLKDGGRSEYFNLKANQYRNVFSDLLFFESEVKYSEFLSYDPKKKVAKYLITTYTANKVGPTENIKRVPVNDDLQHENFIKNADLLKEKPMPFYRAIKYDYLLQCCLVQGQPDFWFHNFKTGFDSLFLDYWLDLKIQMTFEDYVKQLQIKKSSLPSNKVDNQNEEHTKSPQKIDIGAQRSKKNKPEIKPIFNPDAIDEIWNLFKCYFDNDDRIQLLEVFKTGKTPDKKLLFMGYAKTLLDALKQLLVGQFVTVPVQDDYAKWISNVFEFYHKGERNIITPKYASNIISSNDRAAQGNRLFDAKKVDGKFELVQLKIESRKQN